MCERVRSTYIHTYNAIVVGGGGMKGASACHCHIFKANVTIDKKARQTVEENKKYATFLLFLLLLFCFGANVLSLSHWRGQLCAWCGGGGVVAALQLSLHFAFASFVLYTESCYKYTHASTKRAHLCKCRIHMHVHTYIRLSISSFKRN